MHPNILLETDHIIRTDDHYTKVLRMTDRSTEAREVPTEEEWHPLPEEDDQCRPRNQMEVLSLLRILTPTCIELQVDRHLFYEIAVTECHGVVTTNLWELLHHTVVHTGAA